MLDVDGRDHVDPGLEHVVDVLPALLVAHLRRVRVRELVDERELGMPGNHGVDIHLVEIERSVLGAEPRHDFEPVGEHGRLGAVMRLEIADRDVRSALLRLPSFEEHPVRLADAGSHPQEYPIVASSHSGHAPKRLWTTRSMSLIPTNGRIIPPRP